MNTILQKRIEEAAYRESSIYDITAIKESNAAYYAAIKVATFALQNQWISVEEALPEEDEDGSNTSIYVLVTDSTNPFGYIWKAYYDFIIKDWYDAMTCENLTMCNITHWMSIPSLKGCEK